MGFYVCVCVCLCMCVILCVMKIYTPLRTAREIDGERERDEGMGNK